MHYFVHLPAGYATSGLRYPVIYFLHGLPADATAYQSLTWVATALDQTGRQAILVVPQGASASKSDPEYHDWGPGENWETALAVDLPAYIDAHYRTIATRTGRAIVGVSAGGYGATILGVHHLPAFAAIESWSGYFRPTDPTGEETLELGSRADNDYASVHALAAGLRKQFRRHATFLAFYVGRADTTFVADNTRLHRELTRAGVAHTFGVYPGAHTTSLWAAHAAGWLDMALDHLSSPA